MSFDVEAVLANLKQHEKIALLSGKLHTCTDLRVVITG